MDIVACHKEYWKMIRNIQLSNSYYKFGCSNRIDENMIHSCCSVLSNACQFIYGWHHAMAKQNFVENFELFYFA